MALFDDVIEGLRDPKAPLLHVAVDTGRGTGTGTGAGSDDPAPHPLGLFGARGSGAAERDERPIVVMLHGIASSSATFFYVIPLIEKTHRVIAIDLLGFGGSPQPEGAEYTLEEHVAAIAHTIRSLHLDRPFVLVGHSLGCLIGTRYTATHGSHVTRLVLVSPPVYLSPQEIGDPRVRSRVQGYLQAYQYFRRNKQFTTATAAVVSRLLPVEHVMEITEQNWEPFTKSLQHCIESQTMVSDLASVDVPIDVIYGRLDQFLVPGNLKVIEKMRNVTTHVVNVSDHMIRKPMARVVATSIDAPA